jgi:hypothetical protein
MLSADSTNPAGSYNDVGAGTGTATVSTIQNELIGTMCYMTSGANAGQGREIAAVSGATLSFVTAFGSLIGKGDKYALSPVPFKVEAWKLQDPQVEPFTRWKMTGMSFVLGELSGFDSNVNNVFRCGAFRGASDTLNSKTTEVTINDNPSKAAEAFVPPVDGVEIMPYFEQISSGTMFEITGMEVGTTFDQSRKIGD